MSFFFRNRLGGPLPSFPMVWILAAPLWLVASFVWSSSPTATPTSSVPGCLAPECHGPIRQHKFVHPPLIQGDCVPCHAASSEVNKEHSTDPKNHQIPTQPPTLALCSKCHTDKSFDHKVVHPPFRDKCTACHDPHGGKLRYFLKSDTPEDLCLKCHKDMLQNKRYIHAPVALKACTACHASHVSEYKGLLARPPERLCVFCHTQFKKGIDEAVSVHPPARKACFGCHNPHGGMTPFFLPATGNKLCQTCHADIFKRMKTSRYPHTAMIEGKQCSDCHDPHWSNSTKLLKEPSMEICLKCHDKTIKTKDGRTLPNIAKKIATSKYLHGPIRQKDCTPCHAVHGSNDPRLMKAAFPLDFYAPYKKGTYALCFGCHDPRLVEDKETLATGFRNGMRNLHYVHVHSEKGRSCRACHDEHASNAPFHIRDWVQFGQWKLKIEYAQLPNGGTCLAGCHKQRSYSRVLPTPTPSGNSGAP